jgi:hypothetical protein
VESPSQFFCPAFERSDPTLLVVPRYSVTVGRVMFDKPEWRHNWKELSDGDQDMGQYRYKAGIVHYFRNFNRDNEQVRNLSVSYIAATYRDTGSVYGNTSPLMISCADYGRPDAGYSHDRRGVNAVFIDGSARWIPYEEVFAYTSGSHPYCLKNSNRHVHTPMPKWARKFATIAPP